VNVIARISSGRACCCSISQAIRSTSTVVLPVPAPASTSMGPETCSIASFCLGLGMKESRTATLWHYAKLRRIAQWESSFSDKILCGKDVSIAGFLLKSRAERGALSLASPLACYGDDGSHMSVVVNAAAGLTL